MRDVAVQTGIFTLVMLIGIIFDSYSALTRTAYGTSDANIFPPDSEPYGFALSEWAAKSWQWSFSLPSGDSQEPGNDADYACAVNQSGPVWFLAGSGEGGIDKRACTIPAGKALLITPLAGLCSYADTPNAKSESDLRSCAMAGDNGALIEMSIDGVRLEDINRFRVQSPPFNLTIPEENPFGILPGTTTAVADCWCIMIEPLPAGKHVIHFTVSIPGNPSFGISAFATDVTYDLMIQEQRFAVTTYPISVMANENEIVLPINSSSPVSDFRLNETMRQVSFKVSSEDVDIGTVMLPISRVIQGPYTLTLDGNVSTEFEIINDHTNNETTIKISYTPGLHDITITGTNVVPEFPTSVVSVFILAVTIGIIMTLSRMKYLASR